MDKDEKSAPTILDKFEQFSKIFATVLVPLVLAIGGWIIQTTVEHDKQEAAKIQADRQSALERERTNQQRNRSISFLSSSRSNLVGATSFSSSHDQRDSSMGASLAVRISFAIFTYSSETRCCSSASRIVERV
jgi:hypothetical protein